LSEVGSRIEQFDDIGRRWMELMVIIIDLIHKIYWKHYQPAIRLLCDLSVRKQFVLNFGNFNFQPWIEAITETDTDETLGKKFKLKNSWKHYWKNCECEKGYWTENSSIMPICDSCD
jgi:hypothetical protein